MAGVGRARRLFHLLFEEMLAGGLFADLPRLSFGLMSLVLFALALVGLLALFHSLLLRHHLDGGGLHGLRALSGLALASIGERAHARVLLLLGELRQHDASAIGLGILLCGRWDSRLGHARCRFWRRLFDRLRGRTRAERPALLLLDQNGLGAPMAEALAYMAGFNGPAHVERHLAPATSSFLVRIRSTQVSECGAALTVAL